MEVTRYENIQVLPLRASRLILAPTGSGKMASYSLVRKYSPTFRDRGYTPEIYNGAIGPIFVDSRFADPPKHVLYLGGMYFARSGGNDAIRHDLECCRAGL